MQFLNEQQLLMASVSQFWQLHHSQPRIESMIKAYSHLKNVAMGEKYVTNLTIYLVTSLHPFLAEEEQEVTVER